MLRGALQPGRTLDTLIGAVRRHREGLESPLWRPVISDDVIGAPAVRSNVWLRAAWETASDALALSDAEGHVLVVNPAYYHLYGYNPDEVIGKSFAIIFPEAQRAEAEARYREVFHSPEQPAAFESVVRRRDGTERIVSARVSFLEENGQRVAMLNVIRDVTEEVAARRAAGEAERARRSFLSSVSHDIRNPLAAIRGHAQMLRRITERSGAPPAPDHLLAGVTQIEASAVRLTRLIEELVEVAGGSEGAVPPLRAEPCDAVALVLEAGARHERLANNHTFVIEAPVGALAVRWDVTRIERVLDNLLSNAVKYSANGGAITLRVGPGGRPPAVGGNAARSGTESSGAGSGAGSHGVVITVQDEGIGITAADLPHVFERYRRGANAGLAVPGSGVGLTSVRQIVDQHGGCVEIASREGEGTTVTIWLPLEPPRSEGGRA